MNSRGVLVFVDSNTSGTGRVFLDKGLQLGFEPVMVCEDPERFPFLKELPVRVEQLAVSQPDLLLTFVNSLARRERVAGVISSSEYFQVAAATVARALGLPGADPEALRRCRDKANQRIHLERCGITQPKFGVARTVEEAVSLAERLGDVVVKPALGTGSVGVSHVRGVEIRDAAVLLLGQTHNERGMPVEPKILVEEYLRGPEFSIEIFRNEVVGVTQKFLGAEPCFVEIGHVFPAPLDDNNRARLGKFALDAVRALGLTFGAAHVEAKMTETGPSIVEVNPRLAGGFIPRIVELTCVDLIGGVLAASTGIAPPSVAPVAEAAAIRFILAPGQGVLEAVEGFDDVKRSRGIIEAALYTDVGKEVAIRGDFRDRIGHVIAVGECPTAATERAIAAISQVKVRLRRN